MDKTSIQHSRKLADRLMQRKGCAVLSGAGLSTLSGLPDFRGPEGIYRDPEAVEMFDLHRFLEDPKFFFSRAAEFIYQIHSIEPSFVHFLLGEWESCGIIDGVVTQNIDMLHHRAGSKNLLELHGSPEMHTCSECGAAYSYEEVRKVSGSGAIFFCSSCANPVKPDITFFGEQLPVGVFEQAVELMRNTDLLLVIGSSLTVYPAALLPQEALHGGAKLVIVNAGATSYDDEAWLRFPDIEELFHALKVRVKV